MHFEFAIFCLWCFGELRHNSGVVRACDVMTSRRQVHSGVTQGRVVGFGLTTPNWLRLKRVPISY